MNVGERIKELRKEKGMTLEDVAQAIGVGRATVLKYENGAITNIPTERVHQLANLFKVTRPYLMGWTDERKVNPSENLDKVAQKLLETNENASNGGYWTVNTLSTMDCTTAATQAARALVKFGISRAPVYPHKVLQQSMLATMVSFSAPEELDEIILNTKLKAFRQANDMVMSTVYTTSEGQQHYIFAVNRDAPQGKIRLALAVELGHIYLGHMQNVNNSSQIHDAECFALHFEFPRALIQLLHERGFVFTKESFQRIFGDCEWCLDTLQNAAPVSVSPELNAMVKELFIPHVNLLEETGILGMPAKGEELDLSRYMEGYEE